MRLEIFVCAFGRDDLLREQKRLLDKYLTDDFGLCVLDNTGNQQLALNMQRACEQVGVGYQRVSSQTHQHVDALNHASRVAHDINAEVYLILDHDIFPREPVCLTEKIQEAGFYGMGQSAPSGERFLWPGLVGFTREWLNGRVPDFTGIPGADAGSGLHVLFTEEDWARAPVFPHSYGRIRPKDDEYGVHSDGYECIDSFVHLTNGSGWRLVPRPNERINLLRDLVRGL